MGMLQTRVGEETLESKTQDVPIRSVHFTVLTSIYRSQTYFFLLSLGKRS